MMKKTLLLAALALLGAKLTGAGFDAERDPFVIGMYSADPQDDKTFKMLAEAGVNYVQTYYKSKLTRAERLKILDFAEKYKMKVMLDVGGGRHLRNDNENYLADVMAEVNAAKGHPALGMWYLCDEPKTEHLPQVAELRREIGKVSDVPTSLVIHWREKWENTRGFSDIWMVDSYPVRGHDFPDTPLNHFSTFVRGAVQLKRPDALFMPVLQACDFTCFPDQARKLEDKSKLRYPNMTEMRFMAYSALTYGVRGMFFYSFYHSHLDKPSGLAWWQDTLRPLLLEIKEFTDAVPKAWDVSARDFKLDKKHDVNLGYWNRPSGSFLILANNSGETRALDIDLTGTAFPAEGELTPHGFTAARQLRWDGGKITIPEIGPWETLIYRVK